jgi:hypothetical protein
VVRHHGGWLAFLEPNHPADLQEAKRIGDWRQKAVDPACGDSTGP